MPSSVDVEVVEVVEVTVVAVVAVKNADALLGSSANLAPARFSSGHTDSF